ncbi:MAG: 4-hydroxy-3-methylbut-2-en-1-yl diphosphate synthase, partial [Lentisphaeria bacterium]|nr:4-hydroxy-3-methylbut-2-en-1-yl diphosphate synthase [Lentisphaeria bacterium]
AAVAACRYPPRGIRGCGVRRANRYGADDLFEYLKISDTEPLVIVQIEHVDAVRNHDAILKVPGLDCICVGPCDLSGSMGILCQTEDDELNKVIDEICRKTKAAGKMLGTASGPLSRWQERGVDWIAMGSDWAFMAQGFRGMIKERDGK